MELGGKYEFLYYLPQSPYAPNADRKFAMEMLKVEGTPTFFIGGESIVGEAPFEEFESKIKLLLKT